MKLCDAELHSTDREHFVWCELEDKHKGHHTALNFAWFDDETTKDNITYVHQSEFYKGKLLFENYLKNNYGGGE